MRLNNPARRFDYVLREDAGSPAPTRFVLRRLTWEEFGEFQAAAPYTMDETLRMAAIAERAVGEGRELTNEERAEIAAIAPLDIAKIVQLNQALARVVARGVVEIHGLLDEDGRPLALGVEQFVRAASAAHLQELADEIIRISRVPEADRKNSPAPPGPTA